ncbi:MAG: nucleotidyltransferase [Bacilli bacterium]|nr:nucleotidyltransferase [Bacilli bacterium]MDD3895656.1 nucleotidyltransferase [Bacilli bacterium]MDD4407975.1 nucleotidyltransferase [Bacilli bacterium]
MDIIGIICEYNPFHNGHAYHINKIKEMYPNSLIILVLNGYFLQRGEVSILTKEDKTKIALDNNIDIVVEHPFRYSSNSADIFAESAIKILNYLGCQKIIFGSESNDINLITKIANVQLKDNFNIKLKENLKTGINYPTALNKSIGIKVSSPNDLLGISYVKAIIKNKFNITPLTIKRTNNYHDTSSINKIISASNIRNKIKNNINIEQYTKYNYCLTNINEELLFNLIKYKIITEPNLNEYLTVDEGIEYRLKKVINNANNFEDLINLIKTKRYTYNRIRRMLFHILIGLKKENNSTIKLEYIKLLGFNEKGLKYINKIKKTIDIPLNRKISENYIAQKYELKTSLIYDLLTNQNTYHYEISNRPIIKKNIDS